MGSTPVGLYSSSGVSAILGLNHYKTPLEAWQQIMEKVEPGFNEKNGYLLPVFEDSAAIRFGNGFEKAVLCLAEDKSGVIITDREKLFKKRFGEIELTSHIDGKYIYSGAECVFAEAKTTNARGFYSQKDGKRRWGDPGTDQVPEEYQAQCAVQRLCSGADEVKLSVLVFEKPQQDYEEMGWEIIKNENSGDYCLRKKDDKSFSSNYLISQWAKVLDQMGNFHTYYLPTNKPLENAIIAAIQKFNSEYVKTKTPPDYSNYEDVKRLFTNPIGSIVATSEMKTDAIEYSEISYQLGKASPLAKRKEALKIKIMNAVKNSQLSDETDPENKFVILDPEGGDVLISVSNSGFRSKKASR